MKIIGICGGNGVILHPFKKHLVVNVEIRAIFRTKGMEQWKANFDDILMETDGLEIFKIHNFKKLVGADAIIGAPDCGHSSMLAYSRAKKLSDPKENDSLTLYIKAVKYIKPKCFLMENLPKLLEQYTEDEFRETFKDYELIFHKVSVSEFGNSQKNRIRLIMIGFRKDLDVTYNNDLDNVRYQFSYIYKVNTLKYSGYLTRGLKDENYYKGHVRENINDVITIYSGKKLSLQQIKDYWDDNPDEKRFIVNDRKFTTAPGVYRNLRYDYPATARKANRQYNHNGLQLSPRELARIQGIPDEFRIIIEKKNPYYWINKARATVTKTPPYEIGQWFYNQLKKALWI